MSEGAGQSERHQRGARAAADPIAAWLVSEECGMREPESILTELAERLIAAGVPLRRVSVGVQAIHPEVASVTLVWHRGRGPRKLEWFHGIETSTMYRGSPIEAMHRGARRIRCKLDGPASAFPFAVFEELAAEGVTDYLALGPLDSRGRPMVLIFDTDADGGFSDEAVAILDELQSVMGLRIELVTVYSRTDSLLRVYLGQRPAERVQSGGVRRGTGELIDAVLMCTDLREFTALSDREDPANVVALLDRYFEAVCDPVDAAGGDVLKFIGDAVLALFPVGEGGEPEACSRALEAARDALKSLDALRREARVPGAESVRMGVALHLGTALFGNIGARRRLDFTVIGASVNEVCRLEPLTKELGVPVVVSERFASACEGVSFAPLGRQHLRGVSESVAVFTLAEHARPIR